jgi:ATP/maltotriose-dependent transcriptional regulator MalT
VPLLYLGRATQARAQVESALVRARQIGQPMAVMLSLWVSAMIELRCGEARKVAELTRELSAVVEQGMLLQGSGPALWLGGWAQAHLGSPREAFARIRQGYETYARLGMYGGNTESLGYAAEALLLAGDLAGADRQLDEAFALARRIEEWVEVPSFMLLRGRVALARGDVAAARASMREPLAESRTRPSPHHELKVLTVLCDLPDADGSDLDALRNVYGSLPEAHGLPIFRRAAELLGGKN